MIRPIIQLTLLSLFVPLFAYCGDINTISPSAPDFTFIRTSQRGTISLNGTAIATFSQNTTTLSETDVATSQIYTFPAEQLWFDVAGSILNPFLAIPTNSLLQYTQGVDAIAPFYSHFSFFFPTGNPDSPLQQVDFFADQNSIQGFSAKASVTTLDTGASLRYSGGMEFTDAYGLTTQFTLSGNIIGTNDGNFTFSDSFFYRGYLNGDQTQPFSVAGKTGGIALTPEPRTAFLTGGALLVFAGILSYKRKRG